MGANVLLTTLFRGNTVFSGDTPGPAPRTDAELGLAGSGVVTGAHKTQAHVLVIKGDTQKADSVAVLDHLWVHAFLCGYGREHHGPRHLHALGLSAAALVEGLGKPSPPDGWEATASGLSTLALFRLFAPASCGVSLPGGGATSESPRVAALDKMVCHLLSTKEGVGVVHFAWSTKGRASYKTQWTLIRTHPDGQAMVWAGHDAIRRSAHASWFEWLEGSAPFFWNWSEAYQREVRDGQQHFLTGPLPVFLKAQKRHRDAASHELMCKKVVKVRKGGYVSAGPVVSGTHYFSVPKIG